MTGERLKDLDLDDRERREIRKYEFLYKTRSDYGSRNHGRFARDLVLQYKPKTLVDIGCGNNQFAFWALSQGIEAQGVDVASPHADVIAPAHDTPYPDNAFDMLTSFDVLEHLLEDRVDDVLAEFARLAPRWVLSICYRDSDNRAFGETLHPTVRPENWWIEKISRYGRVSRWRNYLLVIRKDRKR